MFEAWRAATDRDPVRTKLTADRSRLIDRALRSHGLDDCLAAVRRIGADRWARGENDRHRRFDDLTHALGTAERIERWAEPAPTGGAPGSGRSRDERRTAGQAALQRLMANTTQEEAA